MRVTAFAILGLTTLAAAFTAEDLSYRGGAPTLHSATDCLILIDWFRRPILSFSPIPRAKPLTEAKTTPTKTDSRSSRDSGRLTVHERRRVLTATGSGFWTANVIAAAPRIATSTYTKIMRAFARRS